MEQIYHCTILKYPFGLDETTGLKMLYVKTNESPYSVSNGVDHVILTNEKNEVIAVMAFDSDGTPLNISQNKEEIRTLTNTLAIMMRDSVPELFKRKWRI